MATIRNPIEWGADQFKNSAAHLHSVGQSLAGSDKSADLRLPTVRQIKVADLREVLAKGITDFGTFRTDVVFLCFIYPAIGLILARLASDYDLLPLLFPAASGFALLGPVAAVGLYEMSRRREAGLDTDWASAFGMIRSPSFGAILVLGLLLLAIFLLWMATAQVIYLSTLGPEPPESPAAFIRDVLTTGPGWAMIMVGMAVGFVFCVVVLAISVVSFPLLLDRNLGLRTAIATSVSVVAANPVPMAAWGLIVAGGLVLGSLPLFLGLMFVMPVLGHSTWHLYRMTVGPRAS